MSVLLLLDAYPGKWTEVVDVVYRAATRQTRGLHCVLHRIDDGGYEEKHARGFNCDSSSP